MIQLKLMYIEVLFFVMDTVGVTVGVTLWLAQKQSNLRQRLLEHSKWYFETEIKQ